MTNVINVHEQHFIAYTDGSCRGNPGFGGFSVYGYTYINTDSKKFKKHPLGRVYFSKEGFIEEKPSSNIDVIDIYEYIEYLDGDNNTNNHMELLGVIRAIELSKNIENIKTITIYTDSSYIVNCFAEMLPKWKNNNWKKTDNKEVSHLNEWKLIDNLSLTLQERDITFNLLWVKGHSDNHGNEIADIYSVIGSNSAKQNFKKPITNNIILNQKISFSDYCSSYNKNDLIYRFKDLYFSSSDQDDNNYCFMYNNSEKITLNIGKKTTESIFAMNVGYIPDVINKFKSYFRRLYKDNIVTCCIKLSKLNTPLMLRLINLLPVEYLLIPYNSNTVFIIKDSTPFIFTIKSNMPLITNINQTFIDLQLSYMRVTDDNLYEDIYKIDVTDLLLEDKKIKINNNIKYIDISELIYNSTPIKSLFNQFIYMNIGYDIPSYLVLKSIETKINKIELYITVNKENYVASLYCKLDLDDRDLFVTNIINKFKVIVD